MRLREDWGSRISATGNRSAIEEASLDSAEMLRAQEQLKASGYIPFNAAVDGIFGTTTRAGLVRLQTERGITNSGLLDASTRQALQTLSGVPVRAQSRLPPCPVERGVRWDMCFGTSTYPNGEIYVGEFKHGERHGQGTYSFASGERYVGEWVDGLRSGQGSLFSSDNRLIRNGVWRNSEFIQSNALPSPAVASQSSPTPPSLQNPVSAQSRLPPCPSDQSVRREMCVGSFTDPDDGERYFGEWRDNQRTGQGTSTYPSGNTFVGEYRNGRRNGQGTFTWTNGDRYVGGYINGQRNGQGTLTFANGERYEGEWRDGRRNGQGTTTLANGNRYVGEYQDGKRQGQGTYTFANGESYVGEFQNDQYHGRGTYAYANGDRYVGEFRDNRRNGQGTYTYASGASYVGEHQNGQINGRGTYTFANGARYVGEYQNDQYNGQGTFTFLDGRRHVGEWRDNKRNGQGSLFSPDGRLLYNGVWQNNQFVQANDLPNPILAALPSPARPPTQTTSGTRVSLIREAGTFMVPVRINGVLELHFTVDSGASDVTIPADVVRTLVRTGTISESDFIGEQTYRLADGSTIKSATFRIRQLQVGDRTITNVLGSVANVNGSLLLGQSFLSRFQRVSFDYGQGVLVLE